MLIFYYAMLLYKPILAIELDDSTHYTEKRKKRDKFVDSVYKSIGSEVVHYYDYTYDGMEEDVLRTLLKFVKISCNKCGGFYSLRKGLRGAFGGCSNFPAIKCKSTIKLEKIRDLLGSVENT